MPVLTFILLWLWTVVAAAQLGPEPLPADQAFRVSARALGRDQIEIIWDIADGYYLYRKKMRCESKTPSIPLHQAVLPAGKVKRDEVFGAVDVYRDRLTVPVSIKSSPEAGTVQLMVRYQGCGDMGVCYPPQAKLLTVALPKAPELRPVNQLAKLFPGFGGGQAELLPPDEAFRFFAVVKDGRALRVNWEIADGYYLYREKTALTLLEGKDVRLGAYEVPRGAPKEDEAFGKVEIFHNQLAFDVPLARSSTAAQTLSLEAKFQGCADRGVCYPPMVKTVRLELPAVAEAEAVAGAAAETGAPAPTGFALSEQDRIAQALKRDSFGLTLASFLGFGLLLAFTPCIFPMIPILSGIIVGRSRTPSTARAFLLSLSYVTASALTYTAFGIMAALFGGNLQSTFQQPWIITAFSGVFVLLALSMFGFFHFDIPEVLRAKLHHSSEKHRDGSLWGAAVMGSLSSLVVGPCVAAPLAGALIYIGQTGDAVLGGGALFAMGFGMGAPLLLVGASAGKILPRAGAWMNAVKAVFGVMMLAVAVWMLGRILPGAVVMVLWAMLLIVPAIYLNAIDGLPEQSSGWRKLWKGVGLMMLAYGLIMLLGFSLGNTNPLRPLQGLALTPSAGRGEGISFDRVAGIADLETRVARAAAQNRPVMLDFYADWCISCKEMEAYTFTDPSVKAALSNFVLLQADVTENSENDKALLSRFRLIGPPGVLFFGPDGREKPFLRVIGYQNAEQFLQVLQQAGT